MQKSRVLLAQASAAQTTSGNSATISTSEISELAVDVNVTAVSGTSPSMTLYVDRLGADGNWYNIWTSAAVTAVAAVSTSIGPGLATDNEVGSYARFRWAISGTSPSFTFSASLEGR